MNKTLQRLFDSNELKLLLISLLVITGTFPDNDWSFANGIDPPLAWVYNTLFENGLDKGKHIIFPHGPLAFFMYPLQENILLVTLVTSLLKALLVFNIFWLLSDTKTQTKWLAAFLFAYGISIISEFNQLIFTNLLLLYCNYYLSNKRAYKLLAFFITGFAFYVKAYAAIVSGVLFFSFILYYFYTTKSIKQFLTDCFSLVGFILLFWILMYKTLSGFISYLWGLFHLAQDNSSAASYYPYNNWILLSLFFILLISLFLINKTKEARFFTVLTVLSLFAFWKHGMAREDVYHAMGFFIYTLICLFIFIIFNRKNIVYNLIVTVTALSLFSINMMNTVDYFNYEYKLFRVNNFFAFVSDFNSLKEYANDETNKKISINKLSQKSLDIISNSTVDVYPWDYSIIAVNELNWKPRVVLHSYASYTSWLDHKNADHFNSLESPDYLIIEKNTWTNVNIDGGGYTSIDGRYFLNDEPQTMIAILDNYDFCFSEKKFLILKKRIAPILSFTKNIGRNESTWNEWIKVPASKDDLLRAKLNFNKSILQRIKSFLYKDEQFWIYFKLKNGSLHKYRIVSKNAADGLWINPYIFNTDKAYTVDEIMFKGSNQNILTKNMTVDWEQIEFKNNPTRIENVFNIKDSSSDSILFCSINEYEQPLKNNWSVLTNEQISDKAFKGLKSHLQKATPFSSTFSFPLDSIPFQDLKITADCWIKSPDYCYKSSKDVSLVLSVQNENGNIIWQSRSIDKQLIDKNHGNNISNFIEYHHTTPHCTLVAYVLSSTDKELLIDDFRISIMNNNK